MVLVNGMVLDHDEVSASLDDARRGPAIRFANPGSSRLALTVRPWSIGRGPSGRGRRRLKRSCLASTEPSTTNQSLSCNQQTAIPR